MSLVSFNFEDYCNPFQANGQIHQQNGDEIPTYNYLKPPRSSLYHVYLVHFNFEGFCNPFQANGQISQQNGDDIPTPHYLKPPKSSLYHVSSQFQF